MRHSDGSLDEWYLHERSFCATAFTCACEAFGAEKLVTGSDYPVLNEIREMYKKEGKPAPKEMASTVFYNRGVLVAALHVEAIRNALKAKPNGKITGAAHIGRCSRV